METCAVGTYRKLLSLSLDGSNMFELQSFLSHPVIATSKAPEVDPPFTAGVTSRHLSGHVTTKAAHGMKHPNKYTTLNGYGARTLHK